MYITKTKKKNINNIIKILLYYKLWKITLQLPIQCAVLHLT